MVVVELFKHYLTYWVFPIVHLGLFLWALRTLSIGRRKIDRHIKLLDRPDGEPKASDGPWGSLQSLHARPDRPPFSEVREEYSALMVGYVEGLARLVNILLLSGVVGTLYGLYDGSVQARGGGSGASSLAGAFNAFGVTIAAVVLAGVVIVLQWRMAHVCDAGTVQIAEKWAVPVSTIGAAPEDVEARVMREVRNLVDQFKPVVEEMKQHSLRIKEDSVSLDNVARSCSVMRAAVDDLPAKLHAAFDGNRAAYLKGLQENVDVMTVHQASSLTDMQVLTKAADDAHKAYKADLDNLRILNTKRFDDLMKDNEAAFLRFFTLVDNFSGQIKAVDAHSEELVDGFSKRLTTTMERHAAALDARVTSLVSVAPQVDRDLQAIVPVAAAAAQSIVDVRVSSVAAVDRVRGSSVEAVEQLRESSVKAVDSVRLSSEGALGTVQKGILDLSAALTRMQRQIDDIARAPQQGLPALPPSMEPPAPSPVGTRLVGTVGLAAGAGTFLGTVLTWILLRMAG